MARPKKFTAPAENPYTAPVTQQPAEQTEQRKEKRKKKTEDCYRFNAKFPLECKDYLQEMAWRNRTSITEYVTRLILADMEAHPEWKETIDVLNMSRK